MAKLLIATSYSFYSKIGPVKKSLEELGFEVLLPSGYGEEISVYRTRELSDEEFIKVKQDLFRKDDENIKNSDILLVLNYNKSDDPNYIGGAVFREMIMTHQQGKPIYLYNPIPEENFKDEIRGLVPIVINGDLTKIPKK